MSVKWVPGNKINADLLKRFSYMLFTGTALPLCWNLKVSTCILLSLCEKICWQIQINQPHSTIWHKYPPYDGFMILFYNYPTMCTRITAALDHVHTRAGPRFNQKISSYQYRKSHCGDKTVVRSSYLHNGISYTGKMTSLYWISAQTFVHIDYRLMIQLRIIFITYWPNSSVIGKTVTTLTNHKESECQ